MQLALQLYTMRDHAKAAREFEEVLRRTAEIGYAGVQLSAVGCMEGENPEVDAATAKAMLDRHGLVCCATHSSWERLRDRTDQEIAINRTLGCDYVAIGVAPQWAYEGGPDGFRRLCAEMGPVVNRLARAGIRFGYHNHAVEFERFADPPPAPSRSGRGVHAAHSSSGSGIHAASSSSGREGLLRGLSSPPAPGGAGGGQAASKRGRGERPFDVLVESAPPAMMFELDTYWVSHAGVELVPLIERLSGRLPVVHLKDKGVFGWEVDFAPIGEGNLDWSTILPAFRAAGTEWLIVEQDTTRRDVFDCVRSSYEFLANVLG